MSALDDLVKSGKLRYVGISDAPPWKVAPAQTMAHFRGWNPMIGLPIQYLLPGWGVHVRALHPHFSTGKRRCRQEPFSIDAMVQTQQR